MKNQVQLITYVDRLGGGGLAELQALLAGPLQGLFGGVHLLPFFFPIDGADAGFDPIDHTQVDPRLGDWGSIRALTQQVDVMADVIVNHMSSESPQFKDYSARGAGLGQEVGDGEGDVVGGVAQGAPQGVVGQVGADVVVHGISSSSGRRMPRRACMASEVARLTVPSAMPRAAAVSATDRS